MGFRSLLKEVKIARLTGDQVRKIEYNNMVEPYAF